MSFFPRVVTNTAEYSCNPCPANKIGFIVLTKGTATMCAGPAARTREPRSAILSDSAGSRAWPGGGAPRLQSGCCAGGPGCPAAAVGGGPGFSRGPARQPTRRRLDGYLRRNHRPESSRADAPLQVVTLVRYIRPKCRISLYEIQAFETPGYIEMELEYQHIG